MTTSATDGVRVIRPGQTYVGKQGFTYGAGASRETIGAQRICMNVLPMPDGARAKVHDVPHAPCNQSGAPCTWIVVHSSGSDQDGIVLLPTLDAVVPTSG